MPKTTHNLLLILIVCMVPMTGCPPKQTGDGQTSTSDGTLGRYLFTVAKAITYVGTLDAPRLAMEPDSGTVHLVYLLQDGSSQRIMYTRQEEGEFIQPSLLSQVDGQKRGGGFLASFARNQLIAYWVNVPATSGQLKYKISDSGGRTFTFETEWNQRTEVRWPCVLKVAGKTNAYFFIRERDAWELAVNSDFSEEDETTIDTAQGSPFHLQGISQGTSLLLTYFERRENSDGGRIVALNSTDNGETFEKGYLFEDRMIQNLTSFYKIAESDTGNSRAIHLIFTEETPEITMLYYSRSTDGGATFTIPTAMFTSEEPLTHAPLMITAGRYVLIATADVDEEGPAMRYTLSENNGEDFTDSGIITRNISNPETLSAVMRDDGSVMIVWDDISPDSPEGEQLMMVEGSLRGR